MPARKKARHNPPAKASKAPEAPQAAADTTTPQTTRTSTSEAAEASTSSQVKQENSTEKHASQEATESSSHNNEDSLAEHENTPRSSKSWYGSWPRTPKAAPVAQVVNESISATGESLAKAAAKTRAMKNSPKTIQRKSSSYLSPGASTRSLPVTATTTKLNISSDGLTQQDETGPQEQSRTKEEPPVAESGSTAVDKEFDIQSSAKSTKSGKSGKSGKGASMTKEGNESDSPSKNSTGDESQSTWLGWFARNDSKPYKSGSPSNLQNSQVIADLPESKTEIKLGDETTSDARKDKSPVAQTPTPRRNSDPNPQPQAQPTGETAPANGSQNRSSWLGIWGGSSGGKAGKAATSLSTGDAGKAASIRSNESAPVPATKKSDFDIAENTSDAHQKPKVEDSVSGSSDEPNTGSSWAFWSRTSVDASKETLSSKADVGKLAVAGSPSEFQPENVTVEVKGAPRASAPVGATQSTMPANNTSTKPQSKKPRPKSVEFKDSSNHGAKTGSTYITTDSSGNTASAAASTDKHVEKRPSSRRDSTDNLLLPLFKQTYPVAAERWSLLQQLSRLFYGKPPPALHPSLIKDPPQIKNALAIGVHGYFPGAFIQTVLGKPTGTSIRFAESAAGAIHRMAQEQGYSLKSVDKIALEGEGKIEERLDILWKLLLNWIDTIRKADFILVACHSQGVPVAISLVAKLIGFGCVNGAKIGICAMAGVNLGPFADYKSRWIGGSAGELFDFAKPESNVSRGYEAALDTVLRFGAKVTYIGSLDDQLVSLHSSTFGTVRHPNIYRAVWIDGRLHVPDFLTHLVGFALKLRNLGISDHGLIRELSNPLAGSLVGGEGHSRIYDDTAVYDLAVEFALETTSLEPDTLKIDRPQPSTAQNPYILPFAMRGLLEEDFVRKELSTETTDLLQQFDDWKPTTKVLRDVKYRLEGIRSKL